jgi:glycosyltransferase involved in cell wall biosynthesis
MEESGVNKYKGVIIRNGLPLNSSWIKRVIHWNLSFEKNSFKTKIISANSKKPTNFENGTDSVYYLSSNRLPLFLNYFLSPFFIYKYLLKEKPDFVLLAHGGFLEFYTIPVYCRFNKIPLLIDVADIVGRQFKKNKTIVDYLIIYNRKLFDILILRGAYEIFTISTELENKYKSLYPRKRVSMSIPTSVDIELYREVALLGTTFFKNGIYNIFNNTSVTKIFYAGTITRLNGIDFFLTALSRVLVNHKINLKLIFAIFDGNVNELKTIVKEHDLSNYLLIIPPVEQKYLPILLSRADILFIPEQGFETANSGFPGKTSEYLLSGKPVITTRFSDLGQYLRNCENACLTDIGDLNSYTQLLEKLILNSKFRKEIGNNGELTARKMFSHIDCAKPYIGSICSYYGNK